MGQGKKRPPPAEPITGNDERKFPNLVNILGRSTPDGSSLRRGERGRAAR